MISANKGGKRNVQLGASDLRTKLAALSKWAFMQAPVYVDQKIYATEITIAEEPHTQQVVGRYNNNVAVPQQ